MVAAKQKVVWSDEAKQELKAALKYIRKESPQNADNVRDDIISTARQLAFHPERFAPDKFKMDNDGTYRAFEKHRYRVAYRVLKTEIRILRVRHTSREPEAF